MPNHSLRLPEHGTFLGRVHSPGTAHPLVVSARDGMIVDITSAHAPTVRDICEMDDPAGYVRGIKGRPLGAGDAITAASLARVSELTVRMLSPVDLHAVKAAGVTFVVSLLERVIEEQARGSADKADAIRADIP